MTAPQIKEFYKFFCKKKFFALFPPKTAKTLSRQLVFFKKILAEIMKFQLFFLRIFFLSISSWIFRKILGFFRKKIFFLRKNFIFRFTPHTCRAKFFSRVQTSQRKKIHHLFFPKIFIPTVRKKFEMQSRIFCGKKK